MLDEPRCLGHGIKIGRYELVIVDGDTKPALQKSNELQHARRVDDAALEERVVVSELIRALPEEEVVDDELAYVLLNVLHV